MEHITDLVKALIGFIAGGGLTWLLSYGLKKRKLKNDVVYQEYKSLDKIIEDFNQTNARLVDEMAKLRFGTLAAEQLLQQVRNAIANEDYQAARELIEDSKNN